MSKISEQKALEAYPDKYTHTPFGISTADINDFKREAYAKCYDKAMQDFLEKACEWLKENSESYVRFDEVGYRCYAHSSLIKDFKNHMSTEYHGQNTKES